MMTREEILSKYSKGEYALAVCNRFWFHYVYLYSLLIKVYQRALKLPYWEYNHAARIVDGVVIEMLGNGRVETPLAEWLDKQNRKVAIFRPYYPFVSVPAKPYGFFDIPQIALHHIRKKLGIGNSWNGTDGVGRYEGWFCSEEVGTAIQYPDAIHLLPCQMFGLLELEYIGEFSTYKR